MRLDKWLWAARFYKTRGLAHDAIDGGKVRLNGVAAKPAKEVKPGDLVRLRAGEQEFEVEVLGLNEQRRPATEARQLYRETVESAAARLQAAELRTLAPAPLADTRGRPTKRDRRALERFRGE